MPMPWDFIRASRVEDSPNPDASDIIQEIGASGRAQAQYAYQGRAALGQGIGQGLASIGQALERKADRNKDEEERQKQRAFTTRERQAHEGFTAEQAQLERAANPYTQYQRDRLQEQSATDALLRGVEVTTPADYLSRPSQAGGSPTQLPSPEEMAKGLWAGVSGGQGGWDTLPPAIQARISSHVSSILDQRISMYRPGPEVQALMSRADPNAVLKLKEDAYTPDNLVARSLDQFRQQVYKDPVIQEALLRQDLENRPARDALAQGKVPLAKALETVKGDRQMENVLEGMWTAMESGRKVESGGASLSLSALAAAKPDITAEDAERLKGRYTVRVPEWMIGKTGEVVSSVAAMKSWMSNQKDKLPFLQSIANREPYDIARAAFLYDEGRSIASGLSGSGTYALKMQDAGKEAWVNRNTAQLVEKYGEGPVGGLLATRLLGLDSTPDQVLGDKASLAKEIIPQVDAIVSAVRSDLSSRLGGVDPSSEAALGAAAGQRWEAGLSEATVDRPGPLRELGNVPASVLASAWKKLGDGIRQDPGWSTLESAIRNITLPENMRRAAMPRLFSSYQGNADFVRSNWATIDPKGRTWDATPEKEQAQALRKLAQQIVETQITATPPGVSTSMKDILPPKDQPPAKTPGEIEQQYRNISATMGTPRTLTSEIINEAAGEKYVLQQGRYVRTEDLKTGAKKEEPSRSEFGQEKAKAWIPAQDAFQAKARQLGFTDPQHLLNRWMPRQSASPLVDEVMRETIHGQPLYRHMTEALSGAEGRDLTTAYDGALGTMTRLLEQRGMSIGDLYRELDYAVAQDPSDPVLSGTAIWLGEVLSPNKVGYTDRQFARVIDMPQMREGFEGSVSAGGGQFLAAPQKSTLPMEPASNQRYREAIFNAPWSSGLKPDQRWQSAGNMLMLGIPAAGEVVGDALAEWSGKMPKHYEDQRAAAVAKVQRAIEQKKSYTVPVKGGDSERVNPSDPEYGSLPRELQDWRVFRSWKVANDARERSAEYRHQFGRPEGNKPPFVGKQ